MLVVGRADDWYKAASRQAGRHDAAAVEARHAPQAGTRLMLPICGLCATSSVATAPVRRQKEVGAHSPSERRQERERSLIEGGARRFEHPHVHAYQSG